MTAVVASGAEAQAKGGSSGNEVRELGAREKIGLVMMQSKSDQRWPARESRRRRHRRFLSSLPTTFYFPRPSLSLSLPLNQST